MRIAAGIIGILSGIFGVIGGFLQTGIGVALDKNSDLTESGVSAFWLSWLIIFLSSIVFAKPRIPGILLIIVAIGSFTNGNYFSAPFALVAGIIALFSPTPKVNSNSNYQKSDSRFDIEKYRSK